MDPQPPDDADSSPESSTPAGAELGQVLKRWREENNRSQSVVARKLGTRQPTVSRWESGTSLPTTEVIRALWRLRNREAEPATGDTQLTEALALHRRAETERNRAPVPVAAVPTAPVPQAEVAEAPEAGAGRRRTAAARSLLAVCGLAALLIGLVFLAQHFAGSTPSGGTGPAPAAGAEAGTGAGARAGAGAGPVTALATPVAAAKPSPPVACRGDSCTSVEPEGSVCAGDAVTPYTGRRYGVLVELRYSPACQAAWAKMRGASPGDRIMLTLRHDEENAQEYRQRDGKDAHTPMAHVVDLSAVRACAIVEGRGTVCATRPASPTTRP